MAKTNKPVELRLTARHKSAFLERVARGMTLEAAAAELGFSRRTFHRLRDERDERYDPEFVAAFTDAWATGAGTLIEAARKRAVDGVDEVHVSNRGDEYVVRRYSDPLLMFLIKQRDPSFRENARLEVTGEGGGPVQIEQRGVTLVEVAHVLHAAGALPAGDGAGVARAALPAAPEVLAEPS